MNIGNGGVAAHSESTLAHAMTLQRKLSAHIHNQISNSSKFRLAIF